MSQELSPYHTIFVPRPDVFALSGREIFQHLGTRRGGKKNLMAIPVEYISELGSFSQNENAGAADALEFLTTVRYFASAGGGEVFVGTCPEISEKLDVALIHLKKSRRRDSLSIPELEKIIARHFPHPEKPVFITNDNGFHIEYGSKGHQVEEPHFLQVSADIVLEGIIDGNEQLQAALHERQQHLPLEEAASLLGREELYHNQFIRFFGTKGKGEEFARVAGELAWNNEHTHITTVENRGVKLLPSREFNKKLHLGNHFREEVLGIRPRDMEQYLAMQYGLLNPEVSLFFLCGSQGSGKTLLGYVTAIDLVLCYDAATRQKRHPEHENRNSFFQQIVLLKPTELIGGSRRDIGFLPGTLYEKMRSHLEPFIDAHRHSSLGSTIPFEEMLCHPRYAQDGFPQRSPAVNSLKISGEAHLPSNEVISMVYSAFLRGRSFKNTLLIIDEAQNFKPYELKTILERMGEGCKAIVMGDPLQHDNPFCSREINGLTYAIKHYLGKPYVALVSLSRNYRSQVSADAQGWRVFSS